MNDLSNPPSAQGSSDESAEAAVEASPRSDTKVKPPPKAKKALNKPTPAKLTQTKPRKIAPAPWTFPKNTLEEALKIPRAIEEQNAGNPMKPDMLAKAVGYNSTSDWRFLDLLRSANLYGLVDGRGKTAPVSLTEVGQDVVAPSSPNARPAALQRSFRTVDDFRKVEDFTEVKSSQKMSSLRTRSFANLKFQENE